MGLVEVILIFGPVGYLSILIILVAGCLNDISFGQERLKMWTKDNATHREKREDARRHIRSSLWALRNCWWYPIWVPVHLYREWVGFKAAAIKASEEE